MKRSFSERVRGGEPPLQIVNEELERFRAGPLREGAFPSRLRTERIASVLGLALAVAFVVCFITGLVSHLIQHPLNVGFLSWPARPGWLYRWNQGLHVAAGTAAIPLLLAKLWAVYDQLWTFPPAKSLGHALERLLVAPLVAGSLFLLFTGLANTAHWYAWPFAFPRAHFWASWIVIGALVAHIGAKWVKTRRSLRRDPAVRAERAGGGLDRRGFLWTAFGGAGLVTLVTVGQTFRPLKELAVLAPRKPDFGPQGFPVNNAAARVGVTKKAMDPGYTLTVDGKVKNKLTLSLAELRAMPQHEADLPITCVEGWSAGARWRGVRVKDLLARAGAENPGTVTVTSLQGGGAYRTSILNAPHLQDDQTLLALEVNGEPLHIDHGFPCRLIAPNRPGVQQTKWLAKVTVNA